MKKVRRHIGTDEVVFKEDDASAHPEGQLGEPQNRSLIEGILSYFRRAKGPKIEIRIAQLNNRAIERLPENKSADLFKNIIRPFEAVKGIAAAPLGFAIGMDGERSEDSEIKAAVKTARDELQKADADLAIWIDCPSPGATLYFRFVPKVDEPSLRCGGFLAATALPLPLNFDPALGDLLVAVALSTITTETDEKTQQLNALVIAAGEKAAQVMASLPDGLTPRESGGIHLCYANLAETIAQRQSLGDLHSLAAKHYREALNSLSEEDTPLSWAIAKKYLADLLSLAGEQTETRDLFDQALEHYRDATKVLTKIDFPILWADIQYRMGQVLYRLEENDGDGDMLKHALSAYQSALQIYNKTTMPEQWADCMHSLAQTAQLLGGQLRSQEALEKSVEACEAALSVRTLDKDPMKWAGLKNTMGSALFLLAKQTKSWSTMHAAANAFASAQELYSELGAEKLKQITEKNLQKVQSILEREPDLERADRNTEP